MRRALQGLAVLTVGALIGLALSGCAHQPAIVVTGESLDAAAIMFEATAAGMASANNARALTPAQVASWNAFLPKFKASYHLACKLWRAAKETGDQSLEQQVAAMLSTMLGQLDTFTALLFVRVDGGPS